MCDGFFVPIWLGARRALIRASQNIFVGKMERERVVKGINCGSWSIIVIYLWPTKRPEWLFLLVSYAVLSESMSCMHLLSLSRRRARKPLFWWVKMEKESSLKCDELEMNHPNIIFSRFSLTSSKQSEATLKHATWHDRSKLTKSENYIPKKKHSYFSAVARFLTSFKVEVINLMRESLELDDSSTVFWWLWESTSCVLESLRTPLMFIPLGKMNVK